MKKLCVTLSMIVLLVLSSCNWGQVEEATTTVLRPLTKIIDNIPWSVIGKTAQKYANALRSRVTKIADAFPPEARGNVKDIAEEVMCLYLDKLKRRDLLLPTSVSLSTTLTASKYGYSDVDPFLPDQIYDALKGISVAGVTAVDGLDVYCGP